ncbi:hypothetical protein [Bradymonas sediminis]|uniref:Uncharacterized protein n=1 Tax=Bradymonas sediminis TaxID=1548548 RepID=A0A2Z4FNU9_9DELT|nr:hypothetical protein [Bradymonas sediminis]AWV90623.1 hypothetical protein DN745_15345 [Bradymonas sediminis]TDP62377.1 hypothetical protein DFR33_11340 [Bradymonas sediminis]
MIDTFLKSTPGRGACRALFIAALAASAGACSTEAPSVEPTGVSTGTMDFAVGARMRSFELMDATCEPVTRAGETTLHIVVPAAFDLSTEAQAEQSHILTAQLPLEFQPGDGSSALGPVPEMTFGPEDARYGASASAISVDFDGEVYPMIQVIAQSARHMVDYQCRASRQGAQIELVCNDALVFPWRNPGAVPEGSFRAKFRCAPAPE